MRRTAILVQTALAFTLGFEACADDEAAPPTVSLDASSYDAAPRSDATADSTLVDSAGGDSSTDVTVDSAFDTSSDAPSDAALDTADVLDAGPPDACTSGALSFDGTDDFVVLPGTTGLHLAAAMTVEAWIKTSSALATENLFLSKHQCGTDNGWFVGLNTSQSGTQSAGQYYVGHDVPRRFGVASLNDGQWHHVAGTWSADAGTGVLYVDGTAVSSGAMAYDTTNAVNVMIGAAKDGTCGNFAGVIDEVSVWSVERTAQQIAQDKSGPLSGSESGLEGYWDFNATGCGQSVADRSPKGRNAQLGASAGTDASDPSWVADGPF